MKIDELLKMEVFQDDTGITPYCLWCTNSCNKCTSNCVSSCADSCDAVVRKQIVHRAHHCVLQFQRNAL